MKRLEKELEECNKKPGCLAKKVGDNAFEWVVTMDGPADSPY